jgi:hypothetical protein
MRIGARLTAAEFALFSRRGTTGRTTDGEYPFCLGRSGQFGLSGGSLGAGDCGYFVDLSFRHFRQFANLPGRPAIQNIL